MTATQNRLKNKIIIGDSNPQRGELGQLFFNTTDKNYYYWDGTSWRTSISGVSAFTDLSDVPHSYAGQALKVVRVNSTENGLEFATVDTLDEKVKADAGDPTSGFLSEKVDGNSIKVGADHKMYVDPTYLQGFFISKTGDSIGPGPYEYYFTINRFQISAANEINMQANGPTYISGIPLLIYHGGGGPGGFAANEDLWLGAGDGGNPASFIFYIRPEILAEITNKTGIYCLDMHNHQIKNLQDPTDPQDAATKNYVDTHGGGAPGGSNEQLQYNNAGVFGGAEVYYKAAQKLLGIDTSSPDAKVHVRRSSGDVAKTLIVDDIETESSTVVEEKGATYIRKIINATYTYRTQQNYNSLILPLPPGLFYPISGVWGYNYGFVKEVLLDGSPIMFNEFDSSWQNGRPIAPGQFAYGGFAWAVWVDSAYDNAQVTVKMEVRELIDSIKGLRVARSYSPDPGAFRSYEYAIRNATDTVLDAGKWDDHPPTTYPDEGVYWTYPRSSDYGIFVFRLKPKLSAGYYNHGSRYMIHIGKEWRHYKVYPSQTAGLSIREIFGNRSYRAAKLAIFHYPTGAISRLSAETLIYKDNARARTNGWSRTIVLR